MPTGLFREKKIMADSDYTPPKVWKWETDHGGPFANTNKPTAGAQFEKELPVGDHPLQLYSRGTPNGIKVTIMLEELLAAGHSGAEYDAWSIDIGNQEQFGSGFVEINPNSKIPALLDYSTEKPTRVFESAAILLYLAEKHQAFMPEDPSNRPEMLSWLMWQMGSAPYLGGGFGHFYSYAPIKIQYAIDRFTMEVKRQLDLLDQRLGENEFICGDEYTIADIAIWPWYGGTVLGWQYGAKDFLDGPSYKNVTRWAEQLYERPPVQRGRMVNRARGDAKFSVPERHSMADFEGKTPEPL
jgi:GST-like protein